jgi:predicted  nucleic acid-binding Zn-ribbon protein
VPTKVEPAVLQRLLDLQAEDTAIKRLEDRRASLPEARRLAEVNENLAELEADLQIANHQNADVAREQERLEGEIELLDQKVAREEQRMYSGNVANPKELSSLQAEVESLKRKKSSMEDELLDVMERKEQISETVQTLGAEREEAARESAELTAKVEGLTGEMDSELKVHESERVEIISTIPDDLLALYDKLRETKNGVGAAALEDGTCQGCHTKLPAKEVERVKSEGGLQRCDNCRRILVVP